MDKETSTLIPEIKSNNFDLTGLAEIRTANARIEYAKNLPKINQLLGEIWQTGELHLLFADTGKGKSILAVQIADKLSKGKSVFPFLINENEPAKVLFYDFELSDKQFQKRYSHEPDLKNEYQFSKNLYIDNIDFASLMRKNKDANIDDLIFAKIESDIIKIKPKVLIIDNITYISMQAMDKSNVALDLIRRLDDYKRAYSLSILVLAHTPKIAYKSPLTINDLAGSKHLSNFADSVSAIGQSFKAAQVRYIKQVKPSRSAELVYDSNNVISCTINKESNFLCFHFLDFESEFEHLNINETENGQSKKLEAIELRKKGLSIRKIADQLGVSSSSVGNWVKEAQEIDDMPF